MNTVTVVAPNAATGAVGGSPLAYALLNRLIVGLGIPLGLWLSAPGASTRPGGGSWFVIIFIPALLLWPYLGFRTLGQLIAAAASQGTWRAARTSVVWEDLRPDLVVRNGWAAGILVIDEGVPRMLLNGGTTRAGRTHTLHPLPHQAAQRVMGLLQREALAVAALHLVAQAVAGEPDHLGRRACRVQAQRQLGQGPERVMCIACDPVWHRCG